MNRDDNPNDSGTSPNDAVNDRIVRRGALAPVLPKDFKAERVGSALRLRITDVDRLSARSGTVDYVTGWASDVDTTTQSGLDAGAARAEMFNPLPAPGVDDQEATLFLQDTRYQSGVFYCWARDRDGNRSKAYLWTASLTSVITDDSIPSDGKHLQVSESSEGQGDVTVSVLSVSIQAPNPLGSLDLFQLWYRNYPNLGDLQEGESQRYTGVAGGTCQFQARNAIGRRKGTGTIVNIVGSVVAGTGTRFTKEVNVGGLFEALGVQGVVQSVDSDTQLTLVSWAGKAVVSFTDWYLYPLITVYCVSVSKGGTRRTDIENAPSVSVLFDGNDSAPNAPSFIATPLGNAIRLDITPIIGTRIEHYNIYRGTGSGQVFSACALAGSVKHDPSNLTGTIPYIDSNFTTYQREQGQTFSYFVTTVMRATTALESVPSSRVESSCRLDAPGDGSATIPAGSNPKNLFWDSFPFGNVGASVSTADAHQDDYMGGTVGVVGPPDYRGYHRWAGATGGGTAPGHDSATEIIIPAPGAGNWSQLSQRIDAWNHATLANRRVDKGRNLMLALYVRSSSPTPANGHLDLILAMMSGGGDVGNYAVKSRISNDTFDYSSTTASFSGTAIANYPNHTLLFAVFSPQTIPVSVDQIEARITHWDTSNGNNLLVTKLMLCYGDELAAWTPEMVLSVFPPPTAAVPGSLPDRDGTRIGWSRIP